MKTKQLTSFLILWLLTLSFSTFAQTRVRGKITDSDTKDPLPFVTVFFVGTNIGAISDDKGEYFLETRSKVDSLGISCVGYKTKKFVIQKNKFQTIDVQLDPSSVALKEVVVKAGENPAHKILKKVIKNKRRNNPDRLQDYNYEVYNKMEFDVNNIDDNFKKKKVFNHFQFIFDYMDTSVVMGKSFLPVFISETLSDYYFTRNPKREKEVIKASKISGVENESVAQYTGQMYLDINIYNNYIQAFEKSFVSPVADFALLTYNYYFIDSAWRDGHWCRLLSFKPRRKQELTFTGEMWITDTTFAIQKVKARIADDANINFVNDLIVTDEYQLVDDSIWFLKKDEVFIDFNLSDRSTGLFGRKTTTYQNVKIGKPQPNGFFSATIPKETITKEDAMKKDTSFWNDARHEKLTVKEEKIYNMVDSIKHVPIFRTFVDFVNMFIGGYYVRGKLEFGPYYKTLSYNELEGTRFRLGGRTSNDFSTRVMFSGHLAYGTKDNKIKYGLGALYMFNKRPRCAGFISYKDDIQQLGQSINAFTEDNILSSVLARRPKNKLQPVRELKWYFEKEWFEGFSNTIHFAYKQIMPTPIISFEKSEGGNLHQLNTAEVILSTHFAYNEKFIWGEFERISMGSNYPTLNIDLTAGLKNVFASDYEYYKVHASLQHNFHINPFGEMKVVLQGGKVFGKVPYPLLRLHEGNETYAFDPYAFNMMNYYEFASDEYASVYAEHHFNGFFLNKIPIMRKLKWREIAYAKGLVGDLHSENINHDLLFPSTLSGLKQPYFEGGVGIENIFKIIRIDAVWRFSYLDHTDIQKFGIRAMLQVIF